MVCTALAAAAFGGIGGIILLWVAVLFALITLAYWGGVKVYEVTQTGLTTPWVIGIWLTITLGVALAAAGGQMSNAAMTAQTPTDSAAAMRTAGTTAASVIGVGTVLCFIHLQFRARTRRVRRRPGSATRNRVRANTTRKKVH